MMTSADLRLDTATLDAIDEIVPPGLDVNLHDAGYVRPELSAVARRRSH
jgi:hypothetical protein